MEWLDDLKVRAQQSASNATQSIGSYLGSLVTEAVVKIGQPQTGNQSAAQLAAGQMGGVQSGGVPAGSGAPALANAQSFSMFSPQVVSMLPMLALVGVGAYFLIGRGGRKGK